MSIALLPPLLVLLSTGQAPYEPIRQQGETLSRIKSIHIKTEQWYDKSSGGLSRGKKVWTSETWRAGFRERNCTRNYLVITQLGEVEYPEGQVSTTVLSAKQMRIIYGWDPDKPAALPLDYAKDAGAFSRVSGVLHTRDPANTGFVTIFDVLPGLPLAKLAEKSQLSRIPSDIPGAVRYEVKAAKANFLVGLKIDLDPEHGYLIRRLMWKDGQVSQVQSFKAFGEGVWVPMKFVGRGPGKESTTLEVTKCEVNIPIRNEDLDCEFPEGARVDEPEKHLIYIWGKDGPVKTFTKDTDFWQYLGEHARRVQMTAAGGSAPSVLVSKPLFWAVNAGLVCLLVILVIVRRRLASRTP